MAVPATESREPESLGHSDLRVPVDSGRAGDGVRLPAGADEPDEQRHSGESPGPIVPDLGDALRPLSPGKGEGEMKQHGGIRCRPSSEREILRTIWSEPASLEESQPDQTKVYGPSEEESSYYDANEKVARNRAFGPVVAANMR